VTTEPIAHTINVQKNKIILDISFNRKKCTNIIPCQQNDGMSIAMVQESQLQFAPIVVEQALLQLLDSRNTAG
jgi:hypothetical protein